LCSLLVFVLHFSDAVLILNLTLFLIPLQCIQSIAGGTKTGKSYTDYGCVNNLGMVGG